MQRRSDLVRLVGEKAVVNCLLGGRMEKVLWDTGAMVSMIDKYWLAENFPGVTILAISVKNGWEIKTTDITSAFLQGEKSTVNFS